MKGGPQFTHISYDDFRILKANLLDQGVTARYVTGRFLTPSSWIRSWGGSG